jgi:hypothetical protein
MYSESDNSSGETTGHRSRVTGMEVHFSGHTSIFMDVAMWEYHTFDYEVFKCGNVY